MQSRNMNNIRFIDVSHHQGSIDWNLVYNSGIHFAFIKATEGIGYTDPQYLQNAVRARKVGVKIGFYHYARPESGNSALAEADSFIRTTSVWNIDLPHVLDIEGDSANIGAEKLTKWCLDFLAEVERRTTKKPWIYTGASFANTYLGKELEYWPLWIAHYGVKQPMTNKTWKTWVGFQYASDGIVPGIKGNVDLNEMDLDYYNKDVQLQMSPEDANKIIKFLSAGYFAIDDPESHAEFKRLANELRKVSGQEEQ